MGCVWAIVMRSKGLQKYTLFKNDMWWIYGMLFISETMLLIVSSIQGHISVASVEDAILKIHTSLDRTISCRTLNLR